MSEGKRTHSERIDVSSAALRALLDEAGELLLAPSPLEGWPAPEAAAERLAALEARADALERVLVVLLLGGTGVGKSTLLNALAREPIVEVSHARRAHTDRIQLYHHEEADVSGLLEHFGGRIEGFAHNAPALRDKAIADAPDIDSIVLEHRALVERFLERVDLVVYVTSPEKYKDLAVCRLVSELKGKQLFVFVMNQIDRVHMEDRPALLEDFRTVLGRFGFRDPKVFAVSAKALEREDGGDLIELERLFYERIHATQIRAIKESGLVAHIRAWLLEVRSACGGAESAERLEQAARAIDEAVLRLQGRVEECRGALFAEVARKGRVRRRIEEGIACGGPWGLFCRLLRAFVSDPTDLENRESTEVRLQLEAAAVRAREEARSVLRALGVVGGRWETLEEGAETENGADVVCRFLFREAKQRLAPKRPGRARALALNLVPALAMVLALALLVRELVSERPVGFGLVLALVALVAGLLYGQWLLLGSMAMRGGSKRQGTKQALVRFDPLQSDLEQAAASLRRGARRLRELDALEGRIVRWREAAFDVPAEIER